MIFPPVVFCLLVYVLILRRRLSAFPSSVVLVFYVCFGVFRFLGVIGGKCFPHRGVLFPLSNLGFLSFCFFCFCLFGSYEGVYPLITLTYFTFKVYVVDCFLRSSRWQEKDTSEWVIVSTEGGLFSLSGILIYFYLFVFSGGYRGSFPPIACGNLIFILIIGI